MGERSLAAPPWVMVRVMSASENCAMSFPSVRSRGLTGSFFVLFTPLPSPLGPWHWTQNQRKCASALVRRAASPGLEGRGAAPSLAPAGDAAASVRARSAARAGVLI